MITIDYYRIEVDPVHGHADIVDKRDGTHYRFKGGYGDMHRHITQPGCDRVIRWLGATRLTDMSIIEALDSAVRGH